MFLFTNFNHSHLRSCFIVAVLLLLSASGRAQFAYKPVPVADDGPFLLSGTLYKDGNGMSDNVINGTPYANEGEKMYVVISDQSFKKLAHALVVDGKYAFSGLRSQRYLIHITWYPDAQFPNLPGSDWVATSPASYAVLIDKDNITNADFGINKMPSADAVEITWPKPANNTTLKFNGAVGQLPALRGYDLEDGILGLFGKTSLVITSLPSSGQLYYDHPDAGMTPITTIFHYIENYDPERMYFKFIDEGYFNSRFSFSFKDQNGTMGPSVDYVIIWDESLEEKLYSISGNLFVDANGVTDNSVNGIPYSGSVRMYAALFSGAGQKLLSKAIVNGKYQFTDLPAGAYYVNITNASSNLYPEKPSTDWAYTGENIGPSGYDTYVNGQLWVTIGSADVAEANFGIEQLPVSVEQNLKISQPSSNQLFLFDGTPGNLPALSGWDAEDLSMGQTGSIVVFTKLPETGELLYEDPGVGFSPILQHARIYNYDPKKLRLKLTGSSYTGVDFSYAFVDAAGIRGPGNWYRINWDSPLPVVLSSFKVSDQEGKAFLQWTTTSESNSDHFEIQHSLDAKNWTPVGNVMAANESKELQQYDFLHQEVLAGNNFYRLKMIDRAEDNNHGTYTYSRIVQIRFENKYDFKVYPNPATDHFTIDGTENLSGFRINIYTNSGRMILESENLREIDVKHLPKGMYVVSLSKNNAVMHSQKIVIK